MFPLPSWKPVESSAITSALFIIFLLTFVDWSINDEWEGRALSLSFIPKLKTSVIAQKCGHNIHHNILSCFILFSRITCAADKQDKSVGGFNKFLCRRSVGFYSRALLVFLMKESKKRRRKQPGKFMAKSRSQPVNLPGAWPVMNPLTVEYKIVFHKYFFSIFNALSAEAFCRAVGVRPATQYSRKNHWKNINRSLHNS